MKKYIHIMTIAIVMIAACFEANAVSVIPVSEIDGTEAPSGDIKIVERWVKREKIKVDTTQNKDLYDEKVIVGKDTVSIILPERNYGRYDRGLYNFLFIPKGQWEIGLTASYGEFDISDYQVLDLLSDIDMKLKGYSVNPEVSYFFKHNQSLGLRFYLTKYEGGIGSLKADIDEDMNFNLSGVNYLSTTYSMEKAEGSVFSMKLHLSLAGETRFLQEIMTVFRRSQKPIYFNLDLISAQDSVSMCRSM